MNAKFQSPNDPLEPTTRTALSIQIKMPLLKTPAEAPFTEVSPGCVTVFPQFFLEISWFLESQRIPICSNLLVFWNLVADFWNWVLVVEQGRRDSGLHAWEHSWKLWVNWRKEIKVFQKWNQFDSITWIFQTLSCHKIIFWKNPNLNSAHACQ